MSELFIVIIICVTAFVISFICGEQIRNYSEKYESDANAAENDNTYDIEQDKDNIKISIDDISEFSKTFVNEIFNDANLTVEGKEELQHKLAKGIADLLKLQ